MARSKLPRSLSGKEVVKILCNKFGFNISRQKGSHVVLVRYENGRKIATVVPLHDELAVGTLKGILELAKVDLDDFLRFL